MEMPKDAQGYLGILFSEDTLHLLHELTSSIYLSA